MRAWLMIRRSFICSRRAAASASLALLVLLVSLGVPMPQWVDTSTPFPCQSHRCGCRDASSLWRDCCCYTLEQKVAWAERQNIPVPLAVQEKVSARSETRLACTSGAPSKTCCAAKVKGKSPAGKIQPPGSSLQIAWVVGADYARCQAGGDVAGLLAQALPAVVSPAIEVQLVSAPWLPTVHSRMPLAGVSPPTPPPRASLA